MLNIANTYLLYLLIAYVNFVLLNIKKNFHLYVLSIEHVYPLG